MRTMSLSLEQEQEPALQSWDLRADLHRGLHDSLYSKVP